MRVTRDDATDFLDSILHVAPEYYLNWPWRDTQRGNLVFSATHAQKTIQPAQGV